MSPWEALFIWRLKLSIKENIAWRLMFGLLVLLFMNWFMGIHLSKAVEALNNWRLKFFSLYRIIISQVLYEFFYKNAYKLDQKIEYRFSRCKKSLISERLLNNNASLKKVLQNLFHKVIGVVQKVLIYCLNQF